MTYTYAYKSSDGSRHEAAIEAPSRDAAFAALRARGIKAIKVVAADGSKANGEVRGVRKRMVAAMAGTAAVVVAVLLFSLREKNEELSTLNSQLSIPLTALRHQLYGDPVVVEEFERGRFENVLPREGDRLLAWFAQPGKIMCPKGLSQAELRRLGDRGVVALESVLDQDVAISGSDPREVRELKQMVNGMREELRAYLANGNGTVRSYWRRLLERTRQEAQIYERTENELKNEKSADVWEEKNESLRRLGLRTIPNPKDAE